MQGLYVYRHVYSHVEPQNYNYAYREFCSEKLKVLFQVICMIEQFQANVWPLSPSLSFSGSQKELLLVCFIFLFHLFSENGLEKKKIFHSISCSCQNLASIYLRFFFPAVFTVNENLPGL